MILNTTMSMKTTPTNLKLTLLSSLLISAIPAAQASVIVTMGNTVTSTWDATPALGTATPTFTSSFSVGGNELEQTITIGTTPLTIDKIEFSYGAPKMTADLSLYIWQMGVSENPTSPGFVDNRAANLLSPNTYAFDTTEAVIPAGSILSFDLTGEDEITLSANTSYVIALRFNNRTNNPTIGYTDAASDAASAYVGGALFYNEAYISGGGVGTDSAFAIYVVPEASTYALAMACVAGLCAFLRRRSHKAA